MKSPHIPHCIPLMRQTEIRMKVVFHDTRTNYLFLSISEEPHFQDWRITFETLESGFGYHEAERGDWIIKGVAGEFYPCKSDIFEKTYEAVE